MLFGQKLWRQNYEVISEFCFRNSKMSLIMTTTQLLQIQLQTGWQLTLQNFVNLRRRISCSDYNNLSNTELKTLTDLNFNIVVTTQMTLLLRKTQPDKTDWSRQ